MTPSARHRAFFALWPDAEVARCLDDAGNLAHQACGGRKMRSDTLHITLAFLGDIEATRLDAAGEAAAAAAAKVGAGDTAMSIDLMGYWRHNHIVWAGCSETPPALTGLATGLADELRRRDFRLESRPFIAHATLLRKAACTGEPPALAPIPWPVKDFVLVASRLAPEGPHYRILRRWPLG